jgi:hypothetical protein
MTDSAGPYTRNATRARATNEGMSTIASPGTGFVVRAPGRAGGRCRRAALRLGGQRHSTSSRPAASGIGEIELPGTVNFTFGGRDRDILFVAADTAIWAVLLHARRQDSR